MQNGAAMFLRYYPDYMNVREGASVEGEGYYPLYEYHDPISLDNIHLSQSPASSRLPSKGSKKNYCRIIIPIFVATICVAAICIAIGTGTYLGVIDPSQRTSPVQSVTFKGSLVINRTFTSGLNDSNSTEYRDLAKNVTLEVDNAYKSSSLRDVYGYSNVTGFSSGSIVAHMQIHFITDQSSGTAVIVDLVNTTLNQHLTKSNSSFAKEIIPVFINLIDIAAYTTDVTTRAPTTVAPTTQSSTTVAPTTQSSTTAASTTQSSTTVALTTQSSTTAASTTQSSTTAAPTTQSSTTVAPTTQSSTTAASTTQSSTTAAPTTQSSTTAVPTTQSSTTAASTTQSSTTAAPTTQSSTTVAPTTQSSATAASTTQSSTASSTTKVSTTAASKTNSSTTAAPFIQSSRTATSITQASTAASTSQSSTTAASTNKALTNAPTTQASISVASTTKASPSATPTIQSSTTTESTSQASTNASTTKDSTTVSSTTNASANTSTTQVLTNASTIKASTTAAPTIQFSTTAASTTKASTNASTTQSSTTAASTTQASTTGSTTKASTVAASTTKASTNTSTFHSSTTAAYTTQASTNGSASTASITAASTSKASTNASTLKAITTAASSTLASTNASTAQSSTNASTAQSSTNASTLKAITTAASSTLASTNASTAQSSTTSVPLTNASTTALQITLVLQTSAPTTANPDSRGTLCPIETFSMLLQGNCSAPLGVMHNPGTTESDICGVYEDLLECLAFHMMLAGMDQCKMEAINNIIFQNFTSVVYTSNGRSLTQNCTNTDFALLQAEIPGPSSQEMCSSISTMRFYMKYVACPLNFSVNLMDEVQCGIAFGILNGIQSFFHGYGFNCDFTQLMSTVSQHEQNSTLQNKLLPPYLLKSLHTCQDLYFNGSLSNNSRLQCAQILANYSCPVTESLNPLIKIKNTTVYTSYLKCSVYYKFIKRVKILLTKRRAYLPCNNELLKTMVNGIIEGYWMESGQNMVQAPDFVECTALEIVDQLESLCDKDTLVALSVMFCPIKTQSESVPIIINPTTTDQWNGNKPASSGMAVSTSWGEFCFTYQSLLQCGLQIANSMDFGSDVNCSHGDMEILFERVEMDNYGLLSNSLPGGLNPVHCSKYSSMFIIELKLEQEWTESLNNVSSPQYLGMIQRIQQSIDQLLSETLLLEFVAEVKVIQIGNWSGWMTPMETDVNLTMKMKSTARWEPEDVRGTLIQAIQEFLSINPFQEIIPNINIYSIYVQPVYPDPSSCIPETFKHLENNTCHQFVNISLLTKDWELCRMYIDLLKCFRLHMLLYHKGDCTFSRIDRIVMATDNNVFRQKEGFIRSHCNSYFNLTTEENILPAEGAICSSTDMIQHVMSQCNTNKVNMTALDTVSLCRVRIGSISCISETFASNNYSCDRDKLKTTVLSLPVGNGNCTEYLYR